MSEKYYDSHETLPNGIKVKRKRIILPEGEEFWIANIAIKEFLSPDNDPRYCVIQSNGKTKDEAINNLYKMAWGTLDSSLKEITEKKKEIDIIENRRAALRVWLDGGKVEVFGDDPLV